MSLGKIRTDCVRMFIIKCKYNKRMLNLLMMMHIVARFPRSASNIITTNMTSYNNSTVKFMF